MIKRIQYPAKKRYGYICASAAVLVYLIVSVGISYGAPENNTNIAQPPERPNITRPYQNTIPLATPEDVAPFDVYLEEIMQKLGALSHLDPLCMIKNQDQNNYHTQQTPRQFATRILATTSRSEVRKQRFIRLFNENFSAAVLTHTHCTQTASQLNKTYAERVKTLAKAIKLRYDVTH